MRREKRQRIVAPIVRPLQLLPPRRFHGKFVHRHQLDRRHAQRFQIRNLLDHAQVRARMLHAAGGIAGESADVHFVNDGVGQRSLQMPIVFPIERNRRPPRTSAAARCRRRSAENGRPAPWRTDRSAAPGRRTVALAPDRTAHRPENGKAGRRRCPGTKMLQISPQRSVSRSKAITSAGSRSSTRSYSNSRMAVAERLNTTNCTPSSCIIAPYGSGWVNCSAG